MNVKSIEISNIAKIESAVIEINQPLNLFFGTIKQGKTTILDCFRYVCGGAIPNDLITHGKDTAYIKINISPMGYIKRSFVRKENICVAKPKIEFVNSDGEIENNPTDAIKKLLNPFLKDQNYFANMTLTKKNQYFVDLFNVDISDIEMVQKNLKDEAKSLRTKIKLYGDIDITPIEKPDADKLISDRERLSTKLTAESIEIGRKNAAIDAKNLELRDKKNRLARIKIEIQALEIESAKIEEFIRNNVEEKLKSYPDESELKELDNQISAAKINNIYYEQYLKNLDKNKQKETDKQRLSDIETKNRELQAEKIKRLAEISKNSGVPGLEFNENSEAVFENTSMDLLSGSQMIKLSSLLSNLYPNDLHLELLDGGEALWTSIYDFIDDAKISKKTILATIVGDAPANIPDEIGVWVVEDGRVEKKK